MLLREAFLTESEETLQQRAAHYANRTLLANLERIWLKLPRERCLQLCPHIPFLITHVALPTSFVRTVCLPGPRGHM